MIRLKRLSEKIVIPFLLILISVLIIWNWPSLINKIGHGDKANAFLELMPLMPFPIYISCILMGWRYNNTGLILSSSVISLLYLTLLYSADINSVQILNGNNLYNAITLLLPINLLLFSQITKKSLFSLTFIFMSSYILLQSLLLHIIFIPKSIPARLFSTYSKKYFNIPQVAIENINRFTSDFFNYLKWPHINNIATITAILFFIVMFVFVFQFILKKEILITGYLGALISVFLGLINFQPIPATSVYFIAAGMILLFTNIDAYFFRAYIDELTGLPGRRSLNETMANLGKKYSIAMIDIDHFKKFNDKYGHKTGDDVLKLVAQKIEQTSGGCKTFRYGGEEFTAIFPGKTVDQALPFLDSLRYDIEKSKFTVRSKKRNKGNIKDRSNKRSGGNIQITISIGVAGPDGRKTSPFKVIKSSDKALYKAKNAGRNCVRTFN